MKNTDDSIEKDIFLKAPRTRVWRAICDAKEFGAWFGVEFESPFIAGKAVKGRIVPTQADAAVAKLQEPHAGLLFEIQIVAIVAEHHLSFRWHPYAVDKSVDYSSEATTLVTFELQDDSGGTRLRLTESGYANIPLDRRLAAFTANDGGWTMQMDLITKYLAQHA
jgi:uncharacterized protein YndB with AHSA1/START domain